MVGSTNSHDGDVTFNRGYYDAWVAKLTSYGGIEWQKTYGGSGLDEFFSILHTRDGGYLASGGTSSNDGDVVGYHIGIDNQAVYADDTLDGWAVKLNSRGELQWQHCFGGRRSDEIRCMIETADGGFIGAGYTDSDEEGWFNHGKRDAFVVRFDSVGNTIWQKLYGGSSYDAAESICQTLDGGFIFVGYTSSNDSDVSGFHGVPSSTTTDLWAVNIDRDGNIVWQHCYGGTDRDLAHSIAPTNDGGYVIAGETSSDDGDAVGHHAPIRPTIDKPDAWVLKIDAHGTIQWQKCLGGGGQDFALSVIQDSLGNYLLGCLTISSDGDITDKHGGVDTSDVWIVKLDLKGTIIWQKCYGGTDYEEGPLQVSSTPDGSLMFDCTTTSNDGDVTGNHGLYDAWVVKLAPEDKAVEMASGSSGFTNPYPNPASNEVHLELSHSQPVEEVAFYSILGYRCYPKYHIEGTTLTADLQALPSGVYLVRTTYPGSSSGTVVSLVWPLVVSK